MDILWFLQDYQMREGGRFLISPITLYLLVIQSRRHDGKPSVAANQKQMPGNRLLSVAISALCYNAEGEREDAGEEERER